MFRLPTKRTRVSPRRRALTLEGLEDRSLMAGVVSFSSILFTGSESSGQASIAVDFTATASGGPFSVQLELSPGTAGTSDFQLAPVMVDFPITSYTAGDTFTQSVSVPVFFDNLVEGTEFFQAQIFSVDDPTVTIDPTGAQAQVNIQDQETAAVTFTSTTTTVNEGVGAVTLQLQLVTTGASANPPLQNDLSVRVVSNTNGPIETSLPVVVVFPAGSTVLTQDFTFSVVDDNAVEGNENFTLSLQLVAPNDAVTTTSSTTLIIEDNDFAPTAVTIPDVQVLEDSAPTVIDLTPFFDDADDGVAALTYSIQGNTNTTLVALSLADSQLTLTLAPDRNGSSLITIRATDPDGNFVDNSFFLDVFDVNDPPTFNLGGNLTVPSTAGLRTFTNFATNISEGPFEESEATVLTFLVSNNNNGLFATQPAINEDGTLTFAVIPGQFGTATVTVLLMDNQGTADGGQDTSLPRTFTITVAPLNVPTASITGPAFGVPGQPLKFRLNASVAPVGASGASANGPTFVFQVNWGDGTTQQFTGKSGLVVTHAFATLGNFRPAVTATTPQGSTSPVARTLTRVRTSLLQNGMDLVLGGTPAADTIIFQPIDWKGNVRTIVNGRSLGIMKLCDVTVYGGGGNDRIIFQTRRVGTTIYRLNIDATVFGGAGNDRIDGSGNFAPNRFFGEAGDDVLIGGLGRDVLRGGAGNNRIVSQPGDVVSGNTASSPQSANSSTMLAKFLIANEANKKK